MASLDSCRLADALADRSGQDATAEQVASAMVAIWQDIDAALSPIIGRRGVVALCQRSLHLVRGGHPWLVDLQDSSPSAIDPAALKAIVARQSAADAIRGGAALFETFHQLLVRLVGSSLTERLLRPVWEDLSRGAPGQDTP